MYFVEWYMQNITIWIVDMIKVFIIQIFGYSDPIRFDPIYVFSSKFVKI